MSGLFLLVLVLSLFPDSIGEWIAKVKAVYEYSLPKERKKYKRKRNIKAIKARYWRIKQAEQDRYWNS